MTVRRLTNPWSALARRYRLGLYAVVALNIVVLAAYACSRQGQTAVVELSNTGAVYNATLDGRRLEPRDARLDAPATGTVWLELAPPLPGLPRPSGIDAIEIRDRAGRVLFRDGFESLRRDVWEVRQGAFNIDRGVLTAQNLTTPNNLVLDGRALSDPTAREYTVRVTYRNAVGGTIGSHVTPDGGAFYTFELVRDFPTFFDARNGGKQTSYQQGDSTFVKPDWQGTLRSVVYMLTRPYPYVVAGLGVMMAAVALVSFVPLPSALPGGEAARWRRIGGLAPIIGLVAAAFVAALVLNREYYGALPHVPDEVAYLFQAKILAAGQLMAEKPPVNWAFDFYELPFMYERGERWASFYPFGHPLVLAIGTLLGLVWLVPPLVGAACVALTYAVGRRFYGGATALLAAALMVASPFFLMQTSNFMSHNTAAMLVLLCLLFVLKRERPLLYGAIAGLAFGLAFNTRPVTAVAMVPALGLVMLAYLWVPATRRPAVWHTGGFIAGALVGAAALLAYNYGLTGDPLQSAYSDNPGGAIGFSNGHSIETALRNQQAQVAALLLVFTGWPVWVGLALVGLPFLLGTRNRWDYFCLLAALSMIGIYMLYRFSGVFEGPRYWYEAMPFLWLLSARGVTVTIERLAWLVGLLKSRFRGPQAPPLTAARVVVGAALLLLVIYGTGGWLTGAERGWDVYNAHLIPNSPARMRQLFGVDDRVIRAAEGVDLDNALVLVEQCGFFRSANCFGSVFVRNDIDFGGNVVWARYVDGRVDEVIRAFPGRRVYVATWDDGGSLLPYETYRQRPAR